MPELLFTTNTPNPLKPQFVFNDGKRHLLYVDEGAPDDGEPFIFLSPDRSEPHVMARCSDYSRLDRPYRLIGVPTGIVFGLVQYIGTNAYVAGGFPRPLDFKVTDLSEFAEFIWTEQILSQRQLIEQRRRAIISLGGRDIGTASLGYGQGGTLAGRNGVLHLTYQRDASEVNVLLHMSAFAFILTRYFGGS
jgi:hypothetical protein